MTMGPSPDFYCAQCDVFYFDYEALPGSDLVRHDCRRYDSGADGAHPESAPQGNVLECNRCGKIMDAASEILRGYCVSCREPQFTAATLGPLPPAPKPNPGQTHFEGCWKDGPRHYHCAVAVIRDASEHALRYANALRVRKVAEEWPALEIVVRWLEVFGNKPVCVGTPSTDVTPEEE